MHKVSMDGRLTRVAEIALENPGGNGQATQLFGLAMDSNDAAFVADYGNRRVIKIAPAGAITKVMRTEEPWAPTGVAWKADNLYVLESGFAPPTRYATRVRKLSADGKITVLATVGEKLDASAGESKHPEVSEDITSLSFGAPYAFVALGVGLLSAGGVTWWVIKRRAASGSR